MSGEEDATREIFGYTSHIPVPVWVEKSAYNACKHCSSKFSALKEQTKQHHCRLCGDMYCGSCTGKYHLPLVYEQKGKKGPTRVCIRCRDSCLSQKENEHLALTTQQHHKHAVLSSRDLNNATGSAAVRPSQFVGGPTPIEIAPPVWDDVDKYVECHKCHKKGGKAHNCRACGHLFCESSACTTKMQLPAFFERKNKIGPARVCGECRFKILGGARLVERLSTDLPELGGDSIVQSVNPMECVHPGCTGTRVSKNGYCSSHVNEYGSGGTDLATSASVAVRWEGIASILTRVALTSPSMNLLQIDMSLRKQVTGFAQRDDYEYLYKGEAISEVFFDIFTAAQFAPLGNQLTIRKKVDTDLLVAQYARAGVASRATAAPQGRGGAPLGGLGAIMEVPSSNPFKRQESGSSALPQSTPPPPPKPVSAFQKPKLSGIKRPPPPSAAVRTQPPPPPGSGPAGPPPMRGPVGPETFRARAKLHFGAL